MPGTDVGDRSGAHLSHHHAELGSQHFQDFLHTHTVFGKKREDEIYTASVSFRWNVFDDASMNLQYSYVRADSNIAVYDYTRNIYTAGIEYRF